MPCEHCPHCQAQTAPDRVADLRAWCHENGHVVLPVDLIREETLALILGRSVGTIRNWAYGSRQIPFTSTRGRRTYDLADVVSFQAKAQEDEI